MNKWKLFSERMTARYRSEAELEGRFEDCLIFILGWEPRAEITRQVPIQFGHENKRADIILKANDKNSVVIELKKQGLQIRDHELGQLFSYMRQTYSRFGFLVGDRISLYYDPRNGNIPTRVISVAFSDYLNTDGSRLMDLISKPSFSEDKLEEFCIEYSKDVESIKKRALETADGIVNIDNLANYNLAGGSIDKKIDGLVKLYDSWITDTPKEALYLDNLSKNASWVKVNIFKTNMPTLNDNDFVALFKELSKKLTNQTRWINMRFRDDKILDIRQNFQIAVTHLIEASDDAKYNVLDDFLEGDYQVWGLRKGFWSELIRIRFPDVPLYNEKTENFFNAIGQYIGDTYEEKLNNISEFYKRVSSRHKNMPIEKLSHLEHFACVKNARNETGRQYMKENFGLEI